jgi:hypothetical protein
VIPGAGELTADQLSGIAAQSNQAVRDVAHEVQWVHSYLTGDRVFCVYRAATPEQVREHAQVGGILCDKVRQVVTVVDPTTAEHAD